MEGGTLGEGLNEGMGPDSVRLACVFLPCFGIRERGHLLDQDARQGVN